MAILTAATGRDTITLVGSRDDWQKAVDALEALKARTGIRERGDVTRAIERLHDALVDSDRQSPMLILDIGAVEMLRAAGVGV